MTFNYDIFPERKVIVARYEGAFTLKDLTAAAETMWNDPRYSRAFNGLADISAATVHVAMNDFRPLVEFVRHDQRTSEGRWAAVATTPLATACGFIYQRALAPRHSFEIFSTWEGACRFLEVDLPKNILLPGTLRASPAA